MILAPRTPVPVKVCGLTREVDGLLAWSLGASALGLIFHPASPRSVTVDRAVALRRAWPEEAVVVGVFVDRSAEEVNAIAEAVGLTLVQLHGRESRETCASANRPVLKAIRAGEEDALDGHPAQAFLLDAAHSTLHGGTGLKSDWQLAARVAANHPLFLAGGIGPENAHEALATVRPFALDVNSGVERAPGIKDPSKLKALFDRHPFTLV